MGTRHSLAERPTPASIVDRLWPVLLVAVLGSGACVDRSTSPEGVTRSDSGGITIVLNHAETSVLEWTFTETRELGAPDEEGGFWGLSRAGVATDARGHVYVLDRSSSRVVVFDPSGNVERTLGGEGGGPGEFQQPRSLTVSAEGEVWVYDFRKAAIVGFDRAGRTLPETHVDVPWIERMATEGGRRFLHVRVVSEAGGEAETEDRLLTEEAGDTTVFARKVRETHTVLFDDCEGVSIELPPLFAPRLEWDVGGGRLAFATGAAYRVDLFEDGRHLLSVRRDVPARAVDEEMALSVLSEPRRITWEGGGCRVTPREEVRKRGYHPTLPQIHRLSLAPDGTLWVERGRLRSENGLIDLFAPSGEYRGTLSAGSPFPVAFLGCDEIVAIEHDSLEVPWLRVYSVEGPAANTDGC